MVGTIHPLRTTDLTEEERDWMLMGPFDGGVPGLVRRVRRILDVSQRGLAAILDVSQSVVARWETGRTSPRASVMEHLLRLARIRIVLHDEDSGAQVEPMRADGARNRGGSRYPAHVDLRVTGWWVPRADRRMTTIGYFVNLRKSRDAGVPAVHYRTSRWGRRIERMLYGTPVDHPANHQLRAEAQYLDDVREERRARARDRVS
jgi:transcriptional regulator with XRE-family HTH domain